VKRILVAVLVLGFCALPALAEDTTAVELKKLQGDWAAVSMVVDGVKSSDDEAQCLFRTVKGNSYTMYFFKKQLARYHFTIDATKQPKLIDITPAGARANAKLIRGIYKLDGNRWTICLGAPGKDRPKEFRSEEGSGNQLIVWEREHK